MPPTRVRMPDGKVVSFPDGTPPDEMQTALAGYGKPQPTTADNPIENPPPGPGLADSVSRFFTGAADRVKSYAPTEGPTWDEVAGGPGYATVIKPMYKGYQAAAAEPAGSVGDVTKRVMASVPLVGPPAIPIYDRAAKGDTAGAAGMGSVDALAMLAGGKGNAVPELVEHPMVRGAGRVIRDFDVTKPFKSIGENIAGPAMDKLSQMKAARGKLALQSPLDPDAGVKVAPGGPIEQPRIPSPAEDMVSSLEQGKSEIPVGPIQDTAAPRSMQPTADMTTGAGGANYSADDLTNLIQRHNIPPAPGEIVGGTPRPTGIGESLDDAAILQRMREDLDAHGRNALHEESTNFAARNKVNNTKTGKAGYGWKRKLPEAE